MLYTYSARQVKLYLGSARVTGYGPDEFLTIEVNDDDWSEEEGSDANVVRSLMPNTLAVATLTLQDSSPFNQVLTAMRNRDTGRAAGFDTASGVVSFSAKDFLGGDKVTAKQCYVKKIANMSKSKSSGTREWTITLVDPIFVVDKTSQVIQSGINAVFAGIDLTNAATS